MAAKAPLVSVGQIRDSLLAPMGAPSSPLAAARRELLLLRRARQNKPRFYPVGALSLFAYADGAVPSSTVIALLRRERTLFVTPFPR